MCSSSLLLLLVCYVYLMLCVVYICLILVGLLVLNDCCYGKLSFCLKLCMYSSLCFLKCVMSVGLSVWYMVWLFVIGVVLFFGVVSV